MKVQYNTFNRSVLPALEKTGLHLIAEHENLNQKQQEFVDRYFEDNVYPVLTPMAMDSSRPFPLIRNKTLNIGALIAKKNNKKHTKELEFATVRSVCASEDRRVPSVKKGDRTVILLEETLNATLESFF